MLPGVDEELLDIRVAVGDLGHDRSDLHEVRPRADDVEDPHGASIRHGARLKREGANTCSLSSVGTVASSARFTTRVCGTTITWRSGRLSPEASALLTFALGLPLYSEIGPAMTLGDWGSGVRDQAIDAIGGVRVHSADSVELYIT